MSSLASASAQVLSAWSLVALGLCGLGLLVLRLLAAPTDGRIPWWTAFWLGFAASVAVLQVWHLFLPANGLALGVLVSGGAVGLLGDAPRVRAEIGRVVRAPGTLLGALALSAWLANRALGPPVGDAGLYHLSAIRWFHEMPLVPGLANLHFRLGFNNPGFLLAAAMDAGPWHGRAFHLAGSVLVWAFALRSGAAILRICRAPGHAEPEDLFSALLAAPVLASAITLHELRISTPDPDSAAALVALAAATHFARFLVPGAREASTVDIAVAVTLSVLAVCLKLSMIGFTLGAVFIGVIQGSRMRPEPRRRVFDFVMVAAAMLVLPWLVRGAVLSGYPFFPAPWLGLETGFAVPVDEMRTVTTLIREHFMPPVGFELAGPGGSAARGWLLWQATRSPELVLLPSMLTFVGVVLVARAGPGSMLWLQLPVATGLVVWILSAPAPRFAYAFFWIAFAAAWTPVVSVALRQPGTRRSLAVLLVLGVPLAPLIHRSTAWAIAGRPDRVLETFVLPAGPDGGFHPPPAPPMRSVRTLSGLEVLVPASGDQVWDSTLPAAPSVAPDLSLRRPGDLRSGFTRGVQ
jgi:hypothetical protein